MNQFLILGTSPFDILSGRTSDMSTYSGYIGGGDIYFIIQVVFFVVAIISLFSSLGGILLLQKAQMVQAKKEKIRRILIIVAVGSFSLIGFNILKSIFDHSFGYYQTVHYYY